MIVGDGERYGRDLRELFRSGEPVAHGGRYLEQHAPDILVTTDPHLLALDPVTMWARVVDPATFVEQMAPFVADMHRARALHERWDREAGGGRARRPR